MQALFLKFFGFGCTGWNQTKRQWQNQSRYTRGNRSQLDAANREQ
jgi:hypothetical protein